MVPAVCSGMLVGFNIELGQETQLVMGGVIVLMTGDVLEFGVERELADHTDYRLYDIPIRLENGVGDWIFLSSLFVDPSDQTGVIGCKDARYGKIALSPTIELVQETHNA